jgi:hypothetical protein
VASGGNGIVVVHSSGADGKRRLLRFHATKINAGNYDPSTNWLTAGGVKGPAGAALVNLANSANLSKSGSFTTIIALKIDKSYSYAAGPVWGTLAKPGPLQYAQIRYNGGTGVAGAQIFDSSLNGVNAQSTIAAGWHVMTMIKSGGTLSYRLDGKQVASVKITSTRAFTAQDFMIGGGFPPASSSSAAKENGVPPPDVGEFQAYKGVLAGSDLTNAEKLAGNSIGLSLGSTVQANFAIVSAGTISQQSQTPPSVSLLPPAPETATDSVRVSHPANLMAQVQTITGTESDPSRSIFLDWHTHGTPELSSSDWVKATVDSKGNFSASVIVDHPGMQSSMFYRIGSGPAIEAWSATPAAHIG